MDELHHINGAVKRKAKIKWLIRALKLSRFEDVKSALHRIEGKINEATKRKGTLSQEECDLIIENVLWAKLFRRFQTWNLKPYTLNAGPTPLGEEFKVKLFQDPSLSNSLCSIYKEHHYRFKTNPAILLPGFVPEGNEAFYLVRHSFLKYGSAYYINFPRGPYRNEVVFYQLFNLISNINQRKLKTAGRRQTPVLVGTSFGCSVILNFIEWLKEKDLTSKVEIAALVFLSPVLCMEDVCVPGEAKQPTLVARAIAPLFALDESDKEGITLTMQKAKAIFSKMFKAGQKQLDASLKQRIPILAIEEEVIDFFNIADAELADYFKRYLSLRNSSAPEAKFVSDIPTLTLLAEGEKDVLTPLSPTLELLGNPETHSKMFPNGKVIHVKSSDPSRRVTHSDLIFNADCYRGHLDPWIKKQLRSQ